MTELLDLSKPRDYITVPGGATREVINPTDLGLWEFGRLTALQRESAQIGEEIRKAKGKVSPSKEKRLTQVLGETVKLLVPEITPRELAQLKRANREQIILVWTGRNTTAAAQDGEQSDDPPARPRIGGGSSRASRSSTAATRRSGSTSRSGR